MSGQPVSLVRAALARCVHRGLLKDASALLRVPSHRLTAIARGDDVPNKLEQQAIAARLQLLFSMIRQAPPLAPRSA